MASDNEFFEDSPRVIYDKSPLQGVICQVRFPTILRIESQPPAEFQEAIRHVFPIFSRTRQIGLQNLPPEIANMVGEAAQQPIQYQFRTEDNSSTIGLQPGSLSLTCRDYNRWENFSTLLEPALEALIRSYNPSFFSRIGLRYQNAIVPTQLGLDNEPWSEIISSNVLGELARSQFGAGRVAEASRTFRIVAPDSGEGIYLRHGIGQVADTEKDAYVIDIDCYVDGKVDLDGARPYLNTFNVRARRAFRWFISERVHKALGPRAAAVVDSN